MLGSDGAEQRRWEGTTNLQTPIVDARGTTFFAGPGCKPQAIDRDGQVAWSLEVSPEVLECGSPIMDARGRLYFTSGAGGVIALGDAE